MENPEVARVLEEIADLLEIQGADPYRVRAYRNAARTVRDQPEPLAELLRNSDRRLEDLPAIGADLAGKIRTVLQTGSLPLLAELRRQVPAGVRELMRIPGVGPKRALALYRQLGVTSPADLRRAAKEHRVCALRGFGEKTEQSILRGLSVVQEGERRFLLAEAAVYADAVLRYLQGTSDLQRVEVAGSFRRRKETVGDLDVLALGHNPGRIMDRLAAYEGIGEVLARGRTRMAVRLKNGLQLDLRVVPAASYGAALQYFTGSRSHSIRLRQLAQELGLKLNEYGLFRGKRRVAGRTEEVVYRALGLAWVPPELREDRGEIERARQGSLPRLVERTDLRGDLQMHTSTTDGRASLEEMVEAARQRGHEYIAITDHSRRVTVARGLDARGLRQQWKAIEKLAARVRGITLLKGVEVDILPDGRLDLPDDVLREADWVIASIHYGQRQSREQITRRLVNAVRHPCVSAIGHPTGRIINQRPGYELDLETVLKEAADYGCLMELNAQPTRLDLDDTALLMARRYGVRVVINSDAHAVEELDFLEYGVYQARRGWLEADDVANTRPLVQFRRLLKR
jgi:DNA polymerase (family 10)